MFGERKCLRLGPSVAPPSLIPEGHRGHARQAPWPQLRGRAHAARDDPRLGPVYLDMRRRRSMTRPQPRHARSVLSVEDESTRPSLLSTSTATPPHKRRKRRTYTICTAPSVSSDEIESGLGTARHHRQPYNTLIRCVQETISLEHMLLKKPLTFVQCLWAKICEDAGCLGTQRA